MSRQWVVVLEAAAEELTAEVEVGTLYDLLDALADARPGVLHDHDRYALQLLVRAANPPEAVFVALARWAEAVRRLGAPEWEVVRAEVLTGAEYERECRLSDGPGPLDERILGGLPERQVAGELSADDLLRQALHDSVTNLATSELFLAHVQHALERARLERLTPTVVAVDLEGLGAVDEERGQVGADQTLAAVAHRLVMALRSGDVAGRLEGGQFALLLHDSNEDAALTVAHRVVDAVGGPVHADGRGLNVTACAGVAVARPGQRSSELVSNALTALSAARDGGRRCQLFGPALPRAEDRGAPHAEVVHDRLAALLLLQRAAVAANEAATLEEAAKVVLGEVCRLADWPVGHLYRLDSRCGELVPTSTWHLAAPDRFRSFQETTRTTAFQPGQGLPGRILAGGRAAWIADVAQDDDFWRRGAATACGIRTALAFPVLTGTEVVGVLEFFSEESAAPNPALLEVMVAVGTQLGRVVERARAETALRRSEERLRALAESANDAIVSIGRDGAIVWWNQAAERTFGYKEAEVVGRSLEVLIPERHRGPHWEGVQRFLTRPGSRAFGRILETEALRADGTEFPVEMSVSTWETAEGRFCTAIIRDLAASRLKAQTLSDAERPLRAATAVGRLGSWRWDVPG